MTTHTTPNGVTVWRYHLPSVKGEGWAVLFLDSIGCFTALSDYGDYGYRWPQAGWGPGDFREFILRCDGDYILRKIAPHETYYGEETLKAVKKHILECRRDGSWTLERARQEWDLLDDYEKLDSRENFARWMDQTRIDEAWELAHYDASRQAKAFIEKELPRLQAVLREELAREREQPAVVAAAAE